MGRLHRIYIFGVCGALGGVLGSCLHQYMLLESMSREMSTFSRLVHLCMLGVLVGGAIGFVPRFADGLSKFAPRDAIRSGALGAVYGAIGGLVAMPIAEFLLWMFGGGYTGRCAGFAFLGAAVGMSETVDSGAEPQPAIFGGILGGVVSGIFIEILLTYDSMRGASGVFALLLLGLCIAVTIAVVVDIVTGAWLEGLPGSKVDGKVFHLDKFREPRLAMLGSDSKDSVYIWTPGAEGQHSSIALTPTGAVIRNHAQHGQTLVNGNPISERRLRDGDELEIGRARFRYREHRGS